MLKLAYLPKILHFEGQSYPDDCCNQKLTSCELQLWDLASHSSENGIFILLTPSQRSKTSPKDARRMLAGHNLWSCTKLKPLLDWLVERETRFCLCICLFLLRMSIGAFHWLAPRAWTNSVDVNADANVNTWSALITRIITGGNKGTTGSNDQHARRTTDTAAAAA